MRHTKQKRSKSNCIYYLEQKGRARAQSKAGGSSRRNDLKEKKTAKERKLKQERNLVKWFEEKERNEKEMSRAK
ncbi:uncharacterized protein ARB_01611 [Trichophyton benhamiae CBS 112371]|uniref:Uncharacterized protein n=1 Tax=Arthroderma benhamiae (strain ATCC MYA-4681 / CBS 112371) TaxID=663331 RepID=D4AZJ3_ARTBC|nr:uncharacterized protein ARB_01611 [Trichophyton benhamiae CBS 112371]EFE31463.1 hypothetical protein ARB_01611 [Trichophyton benhamiae CBS 112371]